MALTNFSYPFGALAPAVQHWGATGSPLHSAHQLASNTNNLLYSPADHQQQDDGAPPPLESDYYKNNPYGPPQLHQQPQQQPPPTYSYQNGRRKSGNTYLPPVPAPGAARNSQYHQRQQPPPQPPQISHTSPQQQQPPINSNNLAYKPAAHSNPRTYGETTYSRFPATNPNAEPPPQNHHPQQPQQRQYYSSFGASQTRSSSSFSSQSQTKLVTQKTQTLPQTYGSKQEAPATAYGPAGGAVGGDGAYGALGGAASSFGSNGAAEGADASIGAPDGSGADSTSNEAYPERPPGFTRVQAGQGSRTQVHAVLDYDAEEGEEDYYDEDDHGEPINKNGGRKTAMPTVTPIQGPIFLKNGSVPVVPLFSYPTINNGSFVQIPIWWTALSVALGLDVRGDIIKGVPCVKRYHQLFCPTAGNSYPIEKIERFIDDNKALMRRMYGDFEMNLEPGGPRQQTKKRKRRFIDEPDIFLPPGVYPSFHSKDDKVEPHAEEAGETYFGKLRTKRQANNRNKGTGGSGSPNGPGNPGTAGSSATGRLDACESKIEIVTPYWASNSAGKIRAIVNTQHFEQAIHQEMCSKSQTPRCENDCGCEQKYKWHRLLAYDPDNDCKGIFMDWFLFPSCCVCRCNP